MKYNEYKSLNLPQVADDVLAFWEENKIFENLNVNFIMIRPDAFWDKQRVENCAKTQKKGEVREQYY